MTEYRALMNILVIAVTAVAPTAWRANVADIDPPQEGGPFKILAAAPATS